MRCKRSSPRLTEKSPAAGGVTIKSARWSFPKFPASSHCPPGCDWSLQSLLPLSHPFPARSYLPRLGEGLDKRRQHGPGPLPPFQLRSLPSPHFQEIQTRMEVRVGVVSGAGREGELRFAPAEERTHAHTHPQTRGVDGESHPSEVHRCTLFRHKPHRQHHANPAKLHLPSRCAVLSHFSRVRLFAAPWTVAH